MKKLIIIIFAFVVCSNAIFANGGGATGLFPIFTAMDGKKPAKYTCDTFRAVMLTGQTGVPLTTGGTSCPGGSCINNGYFAPYYETYQFKNTLLAPQCLKITWTAVVAGGCNITFAYTGTGPVLLWTAGGAPCYTAPINMGSPGIVCMGGGVSYQIEVPSCSAFTLFLGNNNGARGSYNLNITNSAGGIAALDCIGKACIKHLDLGGTPVPTMTQWGLFLFGLILLTLASTVLYNYTRRATVVK